RFYLVLCLLCIALPPRPPLFPYTTLFRSPGPAASAPRDGAARGWSAAGGAARADRPAGGSGRSPAGAGPAAGGPALAGTQEGLPDRKSTRLNSSHVKISYAVFCLKKKKTR